MDVMSLRDMLFWFFLTIFGAGLYVIFEHHVIWGAALIVIGLIGMVSCAWPHFRDPVSGNIQLTRERLRRLPKIKIISSVILAALLMSIAAAIYRHYHPMVPATESKAVTPTPSPAKQPDQTVVQNPKAAQLNAKPLTSKKVKPTERAAAPPSSSSPVSDSIRTGSGVAPPVAPPSSEGGNTLSNGDRERLTDAFFEFSQVLDQATRAWGKANNIKADERGPLIKDLEARRSKVPELQSAAREFERSFHESRQKWKYYANQISFIFGDDPENHATILRNAIEEYGHQLDSVVTLKNIEESNLKSILWPEEVRYNEAIRQFALWIRECEGRLEQAKSSLG